MFPATKAAKLAFASFCVLSISSWVPASAQSQSGGTGGEVSSNMIRVNDPDTEKVSPVRRIARDPNRQSPFGGPLPEPQTMDGADNNHSDKAMNATHGNLLRWLPSDYGDGVSALSGEARPGPREISNAVNAQSGDRPNAELLTDYFWQWGQFLDHDIDLTDGIDPAEEANIPVPMADPWFDPQGTGEAEINFNRSIYDPATGSSAVTPREQFNEISGWIDASNVYGSDEERARTLRALDGTGRLRVSAGDLMPFNTTGLPNAGGEGEHLFLGGDVRANEQTGLAAMHTLFVREHNRQVYRISMMRPRLGGDELYAMARAYVSGLMQVITYEEFVPLLLGPDALPPYEGYDASVDARIINSFSTAAYRLGHSLLSPRLMRVDASGDEHPAGHLPLRDAFFAPGELTQHGIEPVLRGLAAQVCQALDVYVVDDVRNFLFGAPGQGGFDLAALNIQRGRDHGLPGYNAAREAAGLGRVERFADISSDAEVVRRLRSIYPHVDAIDLWVGGLAEDHVAGAQVGPLFHAILTRQFVALRDGDRFWYENRFGRNMVRELKKTRLADVIRRNSSIGGELSQNVFVLDKPKRRRRGEVRGPHRR